MHDFSSGFGELKKKIQQLMNTMQGERRPKILPNYRI